MNLYICDPDFTNIRRAPSAEEWGRWFQTANRTVEFTKIEGRGAVSTVFLGLDHRLLGRGPPVLFETMIFADDSPNDQAQLRCCTVEDARYRHRVAVEQLQSDLADFDEAARRLDALGRAK